MGSGNNPAGVCDSQFEREPMETLGVCIKGKKGSAKCVILRIERYSVRTLDIDNAYGGIKALVDTLRESGLIPGDDPTQVTLSFKQYKVAHLKDKKTVVKIRYPRQDSPAVTQ